MRGKPMQTADKVDEHRIIPAHAGQTVKTARISMWPPDHPRACGANESVQVVESGDAGSSPRMRGKLGGKVKWNSDDRIIPAHAGQTLALATMAALITDHPRACGANSPILCENS